jgi:alkylation response protein AidB-like acyl-CoA dehydrogenase
MGIKSSSTCVMGFENSKGWLIGEPNDGLNQMFTFMNTARLGTAMQGVCHMERSYQGALPWCMDRASMRALSGKKYPDDVADKIIVHPDVRKNLLTIKAFTECGRAMIYDAALKVSGVVDSDVGVASWRSSARTTLSHMFFLSFPSLSRLMACSTKMRL